MQFETSLGYRSCLFFFFFKPQLSIEGTECGILGEQQDALAQLEADLRRKMQTFRTQPCGR